MASAHDVADFFLSLQDEEAGDVISNLKLQKLLYYAQGYHLAAFGCPLFPEKVRKWQHGPVVKEIYHAFSDYGSGGIPEPSSLNENAFDEEQVSFLNEIYRIFGQYSAWKLRNMTHEEPPWVDAPVRGIISRKTMQDYFSDYVEE